MANFNIHCAKICLEVMGRDSELCLQYVGRVTATQL
jgi:hypothetical protein